MTRARVSRMNTLLYVLVWICKLCDTLHTANVHPSSAHRATEGLRSQSNKLIAWHFLIGANLTGNNLMLFVMFRIGIQVSLWKVFVLRIERIQSMNMWGFGNTKCRNRGAFRLRKIWKFLENMFSETLFDQLQCIPNFPIPKCPAADKVKIARWLTSKCSVQCPFLYRRQKRRADQWALCPSSVITNSLSLSSSPICKRYNREQANFITSSTGDCNERTQQEHKAHSGDQSISRMCANDLRAPFHFVSLRLQNAHWVPILQSPSCSIIVTRG